MPKLVEFIPSSDSMKMPWAKPPLEPEPELPWYAAPTAIAELSTGEATVLVLMMVVILYVRKVGRHTARKALEGTGARALNIGALTTAASFKDVFMAYLNAAILEPILSIAGDDDYTSKKLMVDLLQLFGLIFWTFILTDAFDTADVAASFVFRFKIAKDEEASKLKFLKLQKQRLAAERSGLAGSLSRDSALWFNLLGVGLAFAGVVTHRDVIHSWAILILWTIMHHLAVKSTNWGAGYIATLLMPSAALLPLEWCLPLMGDLDVVADSESLQEWHAFVAEQTGITLRLEI